MKPRSFFTGLILLFVILLPWTAAAEPGTGQSAGPGPEPVTEKPQGLEAKLPLTAPPQRIVVLFPQAAALVSLFHLEDRIVGLPLSKLFISLHDGGFFAQTFPKINEAREVGAPGKPSMELILSLKPDLIIEPAFHLGISKALDLVKRPRFRMLGTFSTVEDWLKAIEAFGACIDRKDQAAAYADHVRATVTRITDRLREKATGASRRAMHLIKYGNKLICYGRRVSYANDMLRICGFEVFGADSKISSDGVFSVEEALAFDPDLIFVEEITHASARNAVDFSEPFWKQFRAYREGRVYRTPIDDETNFLTGWYFNLASPLGLLWTAKTAYPDLFADVDLDAEAAGFYKRFFHVDLGLLRKGSH